MKLVLITDTMNGVLQERDFKDAHPGGEVMVVHNFAELEKAIGNHRTELNNEVYLPSSSTPMSIEAALKMCASNREKKSV